MKWAIRILVIVLILVGGAFFLYRSITGTFDDQISISENTFFTIEEGQTLYGVAAQLEEKGIISNQNNLIWLSRFSDKAAVLAAAYEFTPQMTLTDLYQAITQGTSLSDESRVTIVEGLTLKQIGDELADRGLIDSGDTFITVASSGLVRFKNSYDFLADLSEGATLEGYLFPDTYRFFKDSSVDEILRKMLDNFEAKFADLQPQADQSEYSIHELVTLASIIQAEVRGEDEMAAISGIFHNRLEIGMALQADSTINYLTRSGRDRSTVEDLEIDSPYNTYKYPGLPPGPISHPGLAALTAAISPDDTDYL